MRVTVDLSELFALHKAAVKGLRRVPMIIMAKLEKQARLARSHHRYQNRTYHLQQSTFARGPVNFGSDATMSELGARTHYAGYVEARGFQDIAGHAHAADVEITNALIDQARSV